MVDRIEKMSPDRYRIEGARDALEDEGKNGGDDEGDEAGGKDSFDKLSDRTDWNILFDQEGLWQQNRQVAVEDVATIQFLGINLKTDPSLLKVRVVGRDGQVIPTAYLSVSRYQGLQLKNSEKLAILDVKKLTKERVLWITVPRDEKKLNDEITRLTRQPKERTFSQTFKNFISRKTWLQRLGIQDPVSQRLNSEILSIYVIFLVLLSAAGFILAYLRFF